MNYVTHPHSTTRTAAERTHSSTDDLYRKTIEMGIQTNRPKFKKREAAKTYLAIVQGRVKDKDFDIELPLRRDQVSRRRFGVHKTGRYAKTHIRLLGHTTSVSLVEARPVTGRTHQIRVHLAAAGYPILGDKTYGRKSRVIARQALHAYKLRFPLLDGKEKEFTASLPEDFKSALKALDLHV